jgi:hypothetical protein
MAKCRLNQPCLGQQRRGAGVKFGLALVNGIGDLLAQFDAELVKRVDAQQDRIGKSAMFVERDQRAKAGERSSTRIVAEGRLPG